MRLPNVLVRRHCYVDTEGRRNHVLLPAWIPARSVPVLYPNFSHWYLYEDGSRPSRRFPK